jgi:hypothetical protein
VTSRRHLQGCYADLDGLASALAVLGPGGREAMIAIEIIGAKDPAVTPPGFAHFAPLLAALIRT